MLPEMVLLELLGFIPFPPLNPVSPPRALWKYIPYSYLLRNTRFNEDLFRILRTHAHVQKLQLRTELEMYLTYVLSLSNGV